MKSVARWLVNVTRMQFRPGLRLLLTFLPLALLICAGSYFYYQIELRHTREQLAKTEYATVMAGVISLDRSLQYATRDLLDLYERTNFREMLNNPSPANITHVAVDWVSFSRIKRTYHKIRWIDETGNERLRVNYGTPDPERVLAKELQDRKDRYFFADTFKLEKGEVYVSPFDLNIEHDAIEVPYVPTIRLGVPVFDNLGKRRGILMINLFAADMLQRFEQVTSLFSHQIWLINQDGYWLKGSSPEDEFAFMFQQNERNMSSRYPDAWKTISSEDSGQFLTTEGLWSFRTLRPLEAWQKSSTGSSKIFSPSLAKVDTSGYQWKIVSFLPMAKYNAGMPYSVLKHIGITVFFLLISFILSLLLVRVQHARNMLLNHLEEMVQTRTADLQKLNINLSQNEARLRSLFENIPDLIWLKDAKGVYLGCNAAYQNYLGLQESEIVGKTDFELPLQDVASKSRETDVQVFASGIPQTLEMWFTYPVTGRRALFEVIKVLVKTEEDVVVGILSIARDITEHKEAQKGLELSALVVKNSSESIQITNASNEIVAVNPAFEQITGYTQEEVLGKNPSIVSSGRQDNAFYSAMWESINKTGFWQGELWNRRKNGELYAAWLTINAVYNEDGTVRNYIELCTDFTKEKEAEDLIWRQANFDFLTGLLNRSMFMDRLRQEIVKAHRTDSKLALLIIGLDNFKDVNDAYGHDAGDSLLVEAARRISETVRDIDVASREGGDEFGVILTELENINDVELTARQLLRALSTPFKLGDDIAYITASIGITIYPDDGRDNESLLRNADHAVHVAKERGRNRISYFKQSIEEVARWRMALINDLRGAMETGQFEVVYQPIVELSTGMIHKAESLIRWRHPVRGIVNPAQFIPLAEETGMIFSISEWAFSEVIKQAASWRERYYPDFQISFNMSPVEFHDEDENYGGLFDLLRKNTFSGKSVVVEITEGLLLISNENVIRKLSRFHEEGIEVALDDFGTGYSALSYLKKFEIDYLKIDQSFIHELETESRDMALTEAIIMMGHKLGMKVIAEGVQTEAQITLLTQAGCDYGQGYVFSEPVSAAQFEELLKKYNTSRITNSHWSG
ncbi:MAG: EAL domain-containing protein [Betaproteobacteria bacterium]|nr:EAL domain-containing protein [Betaproteobacteria bacterium]